MPPWAWGPRPSIHLPLPSRHVPEELGLQHVLIRDAGTTAVSSLAVRKHRGGQGCGQIVLGEVTSVGTVVRSSDPGQAEAQAPGPSSVLEGVPWADPGSLRAHRTQTGTGIRPRAGGLGTQDTGVEFTALPDPGVAGTRAVSHRSYSHGH